MSPLDFILEIQILFWNRKLFARITQVKDETVTSASFTKATPQRKVLFYDRLTARALRFEGVITKVIQDQRINSSSIKTSLLETTIETRLLKLGDLVLIKEDQILSKGAATEHLFIFLFIDLSNIYGQCLGMKQVVSLLRNYRCPCTKVFSLRNYYFVLQVKYT